MRRPIRLLPIFFVWFVLSCGPTEPPASLATTPRPREQIEITEPGPLLSSDGTLRQPGWSRHELLQFNREAIPAGQVERLREWDFFSIQNERGHLSLTVTDIGFITLCSADWVEFATGEPSTAALPKLSDDVEILLSDSSHGKTSCRRAGDSEPVMSFTTNKNERRLRFDFPATSWGPAMAGDFVVREHTRQEYLALATPFVADKFAFFYEQKVPGTEVTGTMTIGSETYSFTPTNAVAYQDWGRGVWPEQLLWRWGAAGGFLADGRRFGINLGNGFGDTSYASANILVIDGKIHKLGVIDWTYDGTADNTPWTFRSEDGAVDLTLTPVRVQTGGINLVLKYNALIKAHGRLRGTIRLENGEVVTIDTKTAFAEEMQIRW